MIIMKNKKFNIVALTLLAGSMLFTSCNNDDATNDSTRVVNNGAATVSGVTPGIQVNSPSEVNEGGYDREITYKVTLATPQPIDTYVTVELLPGGTATKGVDYKFDPVVYIPAFASSGTAKVNILKDAIVEPMETFTLKLGSEFDANIKLPDSKLIFNITDKGNYSFTFDWGLTIPGFGLTLCDIDYDVDIFLVNAAGANVIGGDGATIDCPEVITVPANLKDGVYTFEANFYDDGGLATAGITPAFNIPITVNYSRANSTFSGTFVQDAADAIDSDFGNVAGYNAQMKYLATLTVANGVFTISKNGTTVAAGRYANISAISNIGNLNKVRNTNRVPFFN